MSARPPLLRRLALVTLLAGFVLGQVHPAAARLVCARVLLPSPAQQEASPLCLDTADGRPGSFLRATLAGVAPGFTVSNRPYAAWAVAYPGTPAAAPQCQVRLQSSLEPVPPGLPAANWDLVNYLLNHRRGTAEDVQAAIWNLLGAAIPPGDPAFNPPSEITDELVAEARAVGPGFVPQSGQVAGILVLPPAPGAPVLIEVGTVPDRMPLAGPDSFATAQPTPLLLTPAQLLGNDSDPDNDPLALVDVRTNSARGGMVSFDGERIVYTPPADFVGMDSFIYGVYAGPCGQAIGTVMVEVLPRPNRAPVAADDLVAGVEDTTLTIPAALLLANDSDPDGDLLQVVAVSNPSAQGGTVRLDGTNVVYMPPANFNGLDTFTYTISDGRGGTATATVTVMVRAVNDPPVAGPVKVTTPVNTPVFLGDLAFLGAVMDPEGDAVTLVGVSPSSAAGGLARRVDQGVLYTPPTDYIGADTFTYIVQDAQGARATGTVMVTVVPAPLGLRLEPMVLNFQTGLFEQRVTVTNEGALAISAFRLDVLNLPPGVVVWNATGTNNGIPFLHYNRTLEPGATASLRVEYYIPDRQPFPASYRVIPMPPAAPKPPMEGTGVSIDKSFLDTRIPGEARYVIEFASVPGKTYTIVYSDDMKSWKTAVPAVTTSANRTQWYDDGPPKTDSRPVERGKRFYRVVETP